MLSPCSRECFLHLVFATGHGGTGTRFFLGSFRLTHTTTTASFAAATGVGGKWLEVPMQNFQPPGRACIWWGFPLHYYQLSKQKGRWLCRLDVVKGRGGPRMMISRGTGFTINLRVRVNIKLSFGIQHVSFPVEVILPITLRICLCLFSFCCIYECCFSQA